MVGSSGQFIRISLYTSIIDVVDYSRMCPGRFQVEKVEGFEELSDVVIDKVGKEGDNERRDRRCEDGSDDGSDEEGDELNGDGWSYSANDIEDEIISPALYVPRCFFFEALNANLLTAKTNHIITTTVHDISAVFMSSA